MALGAREIQLVIRARDEASRTLAGLSRNLDQVDKKQRDQAAATRAHGQALTAIGAGAAYAGVKILKFYTDSTKAALEYNKQAAYTLTQVDQAGVKIGTLEKIGIRVANAIPAPFEQMQGALYDIFSSMDVNVKDSEKLLRGFSKAAVAGQVDVATAAKGSIAIMNAWQMPAKNVNKVNDLMFQLVRKGVGTYKDFATTIGYSVNSAVRAGQSVENLAGMLAFLTRNGLSASRASTSAGRALDLMVNPKVVKNFKDLGIQVVDSKGNFRDVADVATELGQKLKGMTAKDRVDALTALFKGGGNDVQARRFWDLAVKNFTQLDKLTGDMHHDAGAANQAYNIMFKQPQTQMQLFQNRWKTLRVELGEAFMPAVLALLKVFGKLFNWFNSLSDTTKKWIAIIGAATGIILAVGGALTVVAGTMLIFSAAAAAAGTTMVAMMGTIGLVILAIAALVAAGILIYKNWDKIKAFFQKLWSDVKAIFWEAISWITDKTGGWYAAVVGFFESMYSGAVNITMQMWGALQKAWAASIAWIQNLFAPITEWFRNHWDEIVQVFNFALNLIMGLLKTWWAFVSAGMQTMFAIVGTIVQVGWDLLKGYFTVGFAILTTVAKLAWIEIQTATKVAFAILSAIFKITLATITTAWKITWATITAVAKATWVVISTAFKIFLNLLGLVFGVALDLLTGHWRRAWDDIKKYGLAIWNDFVKAFKALWGIFGAWFRTVWSALSGYVVSVWRTLWNTVKKVGSDIWSGIKSYFSTAFDGFKKIAGDTFRAVKQSFADAFNGLKNIGKTAWNGVQSVFQTGVNDVISVLNFFIGAINKIPGLPDIKKIPKWGSSGGGSGGGGRVAPPAARGMGPLGGGPIHMAKGGALGKYRHATAIVGEGSHVYPEYVIPTDPKYRKRALKLMQQAGMHMMAGGGLLGKAWSGVKGAAKATGHGLETAGKAVYGAAKDLVHPAQAALNWALGHLIPGGSTFYPVAKKLGGELLTSITNKAKKLVSAGGGSGDMSAHSATAGAAQAYARSILGQFGWSSSQMGPLIQLWNGESGWNNLAQNPTSTAFGIAQFLNSTWAGKRFPKTTNYQQQVYDGLQYIAGSYGSPGAALSAWLSRSPHWYKAGGMLYDAGGVVKKGVTHVVNNSGKPEVIFTNDQWNTIKKAIAAKDRPGFTLSATQVSGLKKLLDKPAPKKPDPKYTNEQWARMRADLIDSIQKSRLQAIGVKVGVADFREAGANVSKTIAQGMTSHSSAAEIQSAAAKLQQIIGETFSGSKASAIHTFVRNTNQDLQSLARESANLGDKIKTTQSAILSARSSALQTGNITTVGGANAKEMTANILAKGRAVKTFIKNLKKLDKLGLQPAIINELWQAGVEQGGPVAASLVNSDWRDIKKLNGARNFLSYQSYRLGATGVNITQGGNANKSFLNSLKADKKGVDSAMGALARSFARQLLAQFSVPRNVSGVRVTQSQLKKYAVQTHQKHDSGGWWLPGTMSSNMTRKPEAVFTNEQWADLHELVIRGADASGGRGKTQNIIVNTQEINPVKHAADLGWELTRRGV